MVRGPPSSGANPGRGRRRQSSGPISDAWRRGCLPIADSHHLLVLCADFGVDPSSIEHPKDLKILQEIASGSVVEAAKRGGLTEAQEQQLLGLSPQDYNQLRSIRADVAQQGERLLKAEAAAAAQRQQQAARGPEEAGPLHGQQAAGGRDSRPPSGVDGPSNGAAPASAVSFPSSPWQPSPRVERLSLVASERAGAR